MSYPNSSGRPNPPDMPAVSPLEMPPRVAEELAQRRRINPKSPRQALQPETAPPPPPRSQKARHPLVVVLNFFLMIVVLALLAGGGALYFGKVRFAQPGPLTQPASVLVARGSDLDTIAAQLLRQDVIANSFIFTTAVRFFYGAENELQAGEYMFEPGVSMEQVLEYLTSGRSVLHAITFPEGLTSHQIVERLNADTTLTGEIAQVPPEGSLAPDTYKFSRGETRQQIIEQMQRAQARRVDEAWGRRVAELPLATPEEFVTLASIVEKETGRADERSRVAGVFINRLRAGMRLQSDPTVLYGLFGGAGRPADHQILQSELDRETPYNTYKISGLPPTPIANPGRAALEAVANPSRTDDLYFVADGTGGHAFAATLDEHNRNVARWRQIVEQAAREAAETAPEEAETPPAEAPGDTEAVETPADEPAEEPAQP